MRRSVLTPMMPGAMAALSSGATAAQVPKPPTNTPTMTSPTVMGVRMPMPSRRPPGGPSGADGETSTVRVGRVAISSDIYR